MSRSIRRILAPALFTAALAMGLASAFPAGASAMGTMTATSSMRPIPERICRPNVTCLALFQMTVEARVPLSPGEVVAPGQRVVMDLYGDDPISDDHLGTRTIPFRTPSANPGTCADKEVPEQLFFRSGNTLVIRGCLSSSKRYGPFNEDRSFFDDSDELLLKLRVVNAAGATVRTATTRNYGRF